MKTAASAPKSTAVDRPILLRLIIPPSQEETREAARTLGSLLRNYHLPEPTIQDWELVCTEALANAVRHVSPERANRPIRLEAFLEPQSVEIRIHDFTPGFDLPASPTLPSDESQQGRGLFLIQSLTDSAQYLRSPSGNQLILRRRLLKRLSEPPSIPALEAELESMTKELAECFERLATSAQRPPPQNSSPLADSKILVFETQPHLRRLIQWSLRPGNSEFFFASTQAEALAQAVTHRPALVIIDACPPNLNALATLKQLKANPITRLIPVLMLIASNSTSRDPIASGATLCLTIPFSPNELFSQTQRLISP